jgi:hypothetical protein
VKEDEEDL